MDIIKLDFNEMVTLQSNQVMTTSLKVAEYSLKKKLVDVGYMVKLNLLIYWMIYRVEFTLTDRKKLMLTYQ